MGSNEVWELLTLQAEDEVNYYVTEMVNDCCCHIMHLLSMSYLTLEFKKYFECI